MISDRRWCLTKNDELVPAGHAQSHRLLVCEGGTLDDETARKYGLLPEQNAEPAAEEKAAAPVEDKGVTIPRPRGARRKA
jgi:hypothetical protein